MSLVTLSSDFQDSFLIIHLFHVYSQLWRMRHQEEPDNRSYNYWKSSGDNLQPLPVAMETFEQSSSDLDSSNVSEVIASSPEPDNEASVLFGEPVSHYRDETWKQERVEDSDEDLHEVEIGLICPIEEARKR